jgi:hypothetical protein
LAGALRIARRLEEGEMNQATKCAHPSCDCVVQPNSPYGKYCSDHCKRAGQITELRCGCQHAECR